MSRPKGFGKNYFTLSAIQAYSAQVTLTRRMTTVLTHHQLFDNEEDCLEPIMDDPLLLLTLEETTPSQHSRSYLSASFPIPSSSTSYLHVNPTLPLKEYL